MGAPKLYKIIHMYAVKSITYKQMQEYRKTTQAIDGLLILYQCYYDNDDFYVDKVIGGYKNNHLYICLEKSCLMLKYGINPYWVFDGKPPQIKSMTIDKRRKEKEEAKMQLKDVNITDKRKYEKMALTITKYDIKEVKYLLDILGLQYTESKTEADVDCGILSNSKIVNGVVSEDSDMLLFGCEKLLRNFFGDSVTEIDTKVMLEELGLTLEQLIDLSAILGNDYCYGISNTNACDMYVKFKECECDMDKFLEYIKSNKKYANCVIPNNFIESWIECRKYYLSCVGQIEKYRKIYWNQPNYSLLHEYLVNIKGFDQKYVNIKMNELYIMYTYYVKYNYNLGPFNVIRRLQ